jgi:hypothetical protein
MQELFEIFIDGMVFLVDKNEEVKNDEWCFEMHNGESAAENPIIWVDENFNKWYLRQANMNYPSGDPECWKIVASSKKLKGIPTLMIQK